MPSIERKSIDRIKAGDRLLVDAGVFAKSGQPITEKTIQLLARHKIVYVPTISLTYEERDKLAGGDEEGLINSEITKLQGIFSEQREKIGEKLKSILQPYKETDKIFWETGKKKQITDDVLLEKNPGSLYQPDINAGSTAILSQNDFRFLYESINSAYNRLSKMTRLDAETRGQKNRIPRQGYNSIRLQSYYDSGRLATIGDAMVWHAIDTAFLFLVTMVNINKKRTVAGFPMSEERFDPDKSYQETAVFRYQPEMIVETAAGILLHTLGLMYVPVHEAVSAKPLLSRDDPKGLQVVRLIQRNINVAHNLLKERREISSLSRMIAAMQKEYPDGTGYPPPNENKFIHEFIRLYHIIDTYDELTNPVLRKSAYGRLDVIDYLSGCSGPYRYSREKFVPSPRYDGTLLEEFLQVLAPFTPGEKVYLYLPENRSSSAFVGRVYSYLDSHIPLISVLKDERRDKSYSFGQMLFYIPTGNVLMMQSGKIVKKLKVEWVKTLKIHDKSIDPGDISSYDDIIYGKERPLSRRQQSLQGAG
jgi:hypothetical protein